ncbi:hypothetical protein CDAR_14451 [Caerostris darwini]|uniref:Uncharacterized protein n=1 Tax=Caerostris darwini TaxID=1538125 RepID=A0AAV4QI32_9ARAC|nr:hypothetical protein CDAR_14451 [Caerostris darwini]
MFHSKSLDDSLRRIQGVILISFQRAYEFDSPIDSLKHRTPKNEKEERGIVLGLYKNDCRHTDRKKKSNVRRKRRSNPLKESIGGKSCSMFHSKSLDDSLSRIQGVILISFQRAYPFEQSNRFFEASNSKERKRRTRNSPWVVQERVRDERTVK